MTRVLLAIVLSAALPGCIYAGNGQASLADFSTRGPFVVGESVPVNVVAAPRYATSWCVALPAFTSPDLDLTTETPAVVEISNVTSNSCGGVSAIVHALAVGHGRITATMGTVVDARDFWVEAPDHVVISGDFLVPGAPIAPDEIHVARSSAAALGVDVRASDETSLAYVTAPEVTSSDESVATATYADGFVSVIPASAGTTTLSVSIFGLDDAVTIVVDP